MTVCICSDVNVRLLLDLPCCLESSWKGNGFVLYFISSMQECGCPALLALTSRGGVGRVQGQEMLLGFIFNFFITFIFTVTNNEIWHKSGTACYVTAIGTAMIYCPLSLMKARLVNSLWFVNPQAMCWIQVMNWMAEGTDFCPLLGLICNGSL